jgi:AcrR family transcriptional regulator
MSRLSEPKRKPPREEKRLETVRLIKEAALRLFSERGFEETTTKEIADLAGVAHGTVFLVAPTKEGLFVTVLEEKLRDAFAEATRSLPKRSVLAQLLHVFDALFDFYAREPRLSRVLVKGMVFFGDDTAKARNEAHVSAFLAYLRGLFDRGKERGEIAAKTSSETAASNVLALYLFAVIAFLNEDEPDRRALGARFEAGLETMFRGVLA